MCRPPGQRQTDRLQRLAQPRCPSRLRAGQTLDLLGECDPAAPDVVAVETADLEVDRDRLASRGTVRESPPVPRMHPLGESAAGGTAHGGNSRRSPDRDRVAGVLNTLDLGASQVREQNITKLLVAPVPFNTNTIRYQTDFRSSRLCARTKSPSNPGTRSGPNWGHHTFKFGAGEVLEHGKGRDLRGPVPVEAV